MQRQSGGFFALLTVILVLGGFGLLLWSNTDATTPLQPVLPTDPPPTDDQQSWQTILRAGFGENSTPLPTIAIPTEQFVPPTIPSSGDTAAIPLQPADLIGAAPVTPTVFAAVSPTPPPPTAVAALTEVPVTAQSVTRAPSEWRPPPLIPPLSRDPLGRDHFWLQRPVDSNSNNESLFYYPYGSDGPADSGWRVHHGIDMPNPVGITVRAAGSGEVVWAADGLRVESDGPFQNSPSYGNVIVIQHDFGYRGQPVWTLYAHLSAALVQRGQRVEAGDVIGQVGQSGLVSGPHVHFEVRMGENHYRSTYNPLLWMVSYVGHGVIAGRVVDAQGNMLDDVDVTINNWATGLLQDTTSTYVFWDNELDVNSDPAWNENFVVGDVPVGRYEVVVTINGERVTRIIDVVEGTTTFVELKPREVEPATPQPVTPGA